MDSSWSGGTQTHTTNMITERKQQKLQVTSQWIPHGVVAHKHTQQHTQQQTRCHGAKKMPITMIAHKTTNAVPHTHKKKRFTTMNFAYSSRPAARQGRQHMIAYKTTQKCTHSLLGHARMHALRDRVDALVAAAPGSEHHGPHQLHADLGERWGCGWVLCTDTHKFIFAFLQFPPYFHFNLYLSQHTHTEFYLNN